MICDESQNDTRQVGMDTKMLENELRSISERSEQFYAAANTHQTFGGGEDETTMKVEKSEGKIKREHKPLLT